MSEKCINCKFWMLILEGEDGYDDDGHCRRFPPVRQPSRELDPNNRDDDEFRFTETKGSWWCGEFSPKD